MPHASIAVLAAGALAMVSAFFGICIARAVWADDLRHAENLRVSWDKQQASMEETIAAMGKTIEYKDETIAILQKAGSK